MQSIRRSVDRIFGSKICILSDIHRIRISELTENENIRGRVDSMVETGESIDTLQDDGSILICSTIRNPEWEEAENENWINTRGMVDSMEEEGAYIERNGQSTLFYSAILNAEWGVAEYLLDIGADPTIFPIRDRDRLKFWVLELDDLCLDKPFSQQVEKRIECFQRMDESGVLKKRDTKFTKRVLFVGQCDAKDVKKSLIKRLPESMITENDLFQKYCTNDWIHKYALIIKEGRAVTFNQFRFAFREGSLKFIQMLCREGIKTFRHFEAYPITLTQASYHFETLISPFRNDKKINFIQHFLEKNQFKECGQVLLRAAAVYGCSDLVEKYLRMFHVDYFRFYRDGHLIDEMFEVCGARGIKEEIDPYSGFINTLKLILTKATHENNKTVEVEKIFKRNDGKLLARMILQNRTDLVERVIFNHVYAFSDRVDIRFYNPGAHLACCAVACSDSEMVEFLTKQGLDFRSDSCRCIGSPEYRQSPLICGLKILLGMKRKNVKTIGHMNEAESLEYIGKTVSNAYHIAGDPTRFDQMEYYCAYSRYCRGECVLSVVIFNTDNIYSREFKSELLKHFLDACDFDLDLPPKKEISIYDFFVPNKMVESGMFCLFQAGASTEYIRYFSNEFQERTQHSYSKYLYNTNLCVALVLDNNNFLTMCLSRISVEMTSIRSLFQSTSHIYGLYTSPVFEQLIEEFLEWYRHVTSSPCSLQFQCRTVIRKTLIVASGHKSILKKIKLLHLPEKLKKFLIYE